MKITDLNIGSKVFLDIERRNLYFTLTSKVLDIDEEGVHITPPYDRNGEIQSINERDKVYLRLIKERGIVRWLCSSWEDRRIKDLKTLYLISEDSAGVENRREAFRLPVDKDITVTNLKTEKEIPAHFRDISLTGVGLLLREEVGQGDKLAINIQGYGEEVDLIVKVVRSEKIDEDKIIHGCITLKSGNSLVKYINKQQQAELRKRSSLE